MPDGAVAVIDAVPKELEAKVVAARAAHRRGQDWLGPEPGVAPWTVGRVLRRHHVPRLCILDPLTGEVVASKTTAVRYERDHPGDLVHMDVKKIGRIPDGGGWRAHGRQMGSTSAKKKVRVGYDYVHSLVDDHARLAYSEVLDDEKAATCAAFLRPRCRPLRRSRHHPHRRGHDRQPLELHPQHPARPPAPRPRCQAPADQAALPLAERQGRRFNRTLQTEWAYRQVFTTNTARSDVLAPWLEHYNTQRRHSALGGHPPTPAFTNLMAEYS